jgi:hypothetical protein
MGKDELLLELKQVLLKEVPNAVQKIKLNQGDKVCLHILAWNRL